MKYKLLFLASLFYSIILFSQTNNGIVKYECSLITNELEAFLSKHDSIQKKYIFTQKIIDETDPISFTLKFNKNESIFSIDEELEPDNKLNINRIFFKDHVYYNNQKDSTSLKKIDAYGDQFLIENNNTKFKWELKNKSKKIGKYVCYKATLKINGNESMFIEAWYTPKLNKLITPLGYSGLPGAILELTRKAGKEGRYISKFQVRDISYKKKPLKIKKPTKGKKITQEEFEKIGREAMDGLKNR